MTYQFDQWLADGYEAILQRGIDYKMSEQDFVSALLQAAVFRSVRVTYNILENSVYIRVEKL